MPLVKKMIFGIEIPAGFVFWQLVIFQFLYVSSRLHMQTIDPTTSTTNNSSNYTMPPPIAIVKNATISSMSTIIESDGFDVSGHYFLVRVKEIPHINPQLPWIHQPQEQPCGWLGANGESDAICFPPSMDYNTNGTIVLPRAIGLDNTSFTSNTNRQAGCVIFCGLMIQPSNAVPYWVRVYRQNDLGEKVLELTTNEQDNTGFRLRLLNETEIWLEIRVQHQFATPTSWFREIDGRRIAPTCFSDFNYIAGECYPSDRGGGGAWP